MESGLSAAASLNVTTAELQAFVNDFGAGDLVVAARRFDAVRYIVVACLTIALMDRILIINRELPRIWNGSLTIPKFFYFLNRYPNLCCVGLDVFVFTQRDRSDCVWWFTFRTWAAIVVSTILEALLVFKLWVMFGRCKYVLAGFSTLSIAQTIGTSFLVKPRMRCVKAAPIPGEWFSGCFPLFTHPHDVSHEWLSLTGVISVMALTAIVWTISTWRKNPNSSLWNIAIQHSIFHIVGLGLTSLFCAVFFLNAPQPLSCIVPSVSSTMFSVFGCRIALDMPDYPRWGALRELDHELDEISRRKRGDIESATHSINGSSNGFSGISNLDCIKPVVGTTTPAPAAPAATVAPGPIEQGVSPLSQASTLAPPTELAATGEDVEPRGVQPIGQFHASDVTLSSNETNQAPQAQQQAATKTPAESRRSTLVGGASGVGPPFQIDSMMKVPVEREARGASGIRITSPAPIAKAGPNQEEEEEDDDLDRELAAKFDENGRIKRTHRRVWKSDDYMGLSPMLASQGFLMPRASTPLQGRPASAIYYSSRQNFASAASSSSTGMVFPQQPSVFPLNSSTPSGSTSPTRRRSADRSTSPRNRMSLLLFHRRRNDVGSVALPEEEVPSSFAATAATTTTTTTMAQDPPPSPIRRHSTSSSRSRVRRLLAGSSSPPPSSPTSASATTYPPLPPSSPTLPSPIASVRQNSGRFSRRDSDAMSICTVSTGFAFDNEGAYEAPDFN